MSPAQFVWHTATASITQCSRCKNTSHRHGMLHWMCSRDAQAGKWCVSWWACHWCHSLDSSCTRQRARSAIFMVRESLFPIRYNGRGQSWASWWPSGQRFINAQFAISIDSSSICNNRIRHTSSALDNVFLGVIRLGSMTPLLTSGAFQSRLPRRRRLLRQRRLPRQWLLSRQRPRLSFLQALRPKLLHWRLLPKVLRLMRR